MTQAQNTKRWILTALFTAMTAISTMVLTIPTPTGGYVHLGDTLVLLSAYMLGPWYGAIAAGVGSALADLLLGYVAYVPGTLVIKGLMALVAGLLLSLVGKKMPGRLVCGTAAEVVMLVGYWLYAGILYGDYIAALTTIPSNMVQAIFGVVASTALVMALERVPSMRRSLV